MNLKHEINQLKEKASKRSNTEIKAIMTDATENLKKQEIEKNALQFGDKIPEFTLSNATGENISIYNLLAQGPLILNFYRGAWCPYCNLELNAYQAILPQIKEMGGNLVAISPELPDHSLSLSEKLSLDFEILSDLNNDVARQFGLVFKLDEKLVPLYKKMGIDLSLSQGNENEELPVPATYVVDKEGIIVLAHVESDYTQRLEPEDALKAIGKII